MSGPLYTLDSPLLPKAPFCCVCGRNVMAVRRLPGHHERYMMKCHGEAVFVDRNADPADRLAYPFGLPKYLQKHEEPPAPPVEEGPESSPLEYLRTLELD